MKDIDEMIIKMEKVIKAYRCCLTDPRGPEDCRFLQCPYLEDAENSEDGESLRCQSVHMQDALDILEALEPVEPYEDKNLIRGGWIGRETECCGACGNNLRLTARFCDRCGRPVKRAELANGMNRRLRSP